MLENQIITEYSCTGTVTRGDSSKVKIKLVLFEAVSPKRVQYTSRTNINLNADRKIKNGLEIIWDHLEEISAKDRWVLAGFIEGSKRIPILIVYFKTFGLSIYTLKFDRTSLEDILPDGVTLPED